jgi:phenylacetate-CoA ligase
MFLTQTIEQLPRSELVNLQISRLQTMLARIYEKTSLYEQRMAALGITSTDIQTLADIAKLPFTTPADLLKSYPYGLLTMPVSGIARLQTTAGALLGLTQQDIYQQIETVARSLVACTVVRGSVLLLLSHSAACQAVQQAAEGIGVTVVANRFNTIEAQLTALADFGVTTLCGSQQDLQQFAGYLHKHPVQRTSLLLKNILCCTEEYPLENRLTDQFSLPVYSLYGQSIIAPASLAGECHWQNGLHIYEDSFYVEVIDPHTKEPLLSGQPGELVVTTLTREAMPLLRYRTGATALLDNTPCPCGRTSMRLKLVGRTVASHE